MCTLIASVGQVPGLPIVVAANRDEALDRPSSPPSLWHLQPPFIAPRDERAGGTWLRKEFRTRSGHTQLELPGIAGDDPEAQYSLRSSVDLPKGFNANVWIRYVSSLPSPAVPYYATVGATLGWAYRNVEVTLSGQDLSETRHAEFGDAAQLKEIPRSAALRLGAHF